MARFLIISDQICVQVFHERYDIRDHSDYLIVYRAEVSKPRFILFEMSRNRL